MKMDSLYNIQLNRNLIQFGTINLSRKVLVCNSISILLLQNITIAADYQLFFVCFSELLFCVLSSGIVWLYVIFCY